MDTHRIRYFLSLARTGSMTKAAELHHISPPAFSKAMRVFEEEVGRKLLVPSGRGVLLTDEARALVPQLTQVIAQLDAIQKGAPTPSAPRSKRVTVATFEVFSTHFFERAADSVFQGYECHLHEMVPGKMEAAVAGGVADLAVTYIPIPHPELDFVRVAPIQMGIYGNSQAATATGSDTHPRKLPFVVPVTPVEGSPNKVRGLDGWPDDAFRRDIRYRVQMLETALGLCRRGLAYAYIPKFIARLHNETVKPQYALRETKLPQGFTRQRDFVYLIKRKSDHEGIEAKKLASALRRFCASQ
jgi:DNA-binding transcriptional LysR family regulator